MIQNYDFIGGPGKGCALSQSEGQHGIPLLRFTVNPYSTSTHRMSC